MVGAAYGHFEADLRFDGESNYELVQDAVVASFGRRLADGFSLRIAAGVIVGGSLEGEGRTYDVEPGWTLSFSAARQWFGRSDETPFLTTALSLSASRARTVEAGTGEEEALGASDLRLSVLFGYTFGYTFSPYLVARAFGGPVSFKQDGRDRTGSDRHHYALGLGSSVSLFDRLDLLVDATFFGERSLSAGASVAF
jgi:hypothetical protein